MPIVVKGLSKQFDLRPVLQGFSHTFSDGLTCIMGPSGCGKTTLLHILMGLLPMDSGEISGLEGKRKSAVFQENRLCENLSAASNIRLVCGENVSSEDISEALGRVGLGECPRRPVRELSGGMKRRVAIVRALLAEFDVLFLDEPFQGLDAKTRLNVIAFLKERFVGKTVLMVSHDPSEAELMKAAKLFLDAAAG